MDMNRPIFQGHLLSVYSGESSVRPSARQASPALSLQKFGDHSISTSRSGLTSFLLVLSTWMSWCLTSSLFSQPDSIHTVQDALEHITHPQFVQVSASGSGNTSQRVLIDVLPPVLVLHIDRVLFDATAGGTTKIRKSIQFGPELKIPLGTIFIFLAAAEAENTSCFSYFRHYGTQFPTTLRATALQAPWSTLPSRRVSGWRALYG